MAARMTPDSARRVVRWIWLAQGLVVLTWAALALTGQSPTGLFFMVTLTAILIGTAVRERLCRGRARKPSVAD